MAEQTAGTAVIRVRLQISPEDRAILSGGGGRVGAAGGRVQGAAGMPMGVGAVPMGRGGPGLTTRGAGPVGGGMIGAAIALAYASPIGAIAMDAGRGVVNRAQQLGRDISEFAGVAGWSRRGSIPQRATDATVEQLGKAANFATDEQINVLGAINKRMATLDVQGEDRVRGVMGEARLAEMGERLIGALEKLVNLLTGQKATAPIRPGLG